MTEEYDCVYCGNDACPKDNLVIFVREQIKDKWSAYPCCNNCWYKKNPGREPCRLPIG